MSTTCSVSAPQTEACIQITRTGAFLCLDLFNATDSVPVLLLCFGTIVDLFPLTPNFNSSLQVSNLCIRFSWLTNIFLGGTNAQLFSFIAALLEMLRRVQWNFCMSFSPFLREHVLGIQRFQIDSRIGTSVMRIGTRSRARCPCRTTFDAHSWGAMLTILLLKIDEKKYGI